MAGHHKKQNKKKGKKSGNKPNNKKVKDQSVQEVEKIDQGVKEEELDEHSGAAVHETVGQAKIEGATQRKFTYLSNDYADSDLVLKDDRVKKLSKAYLAWQTLLGAKKLLELSKGEGKGGNTPKDETDAEEVDADDERLKLLFATLDESTARNNRLTQDLALLNAGTGVLLAKHDEMKARDLEEASAWEDAPK